MKTEFYYYFLYAFGDDTDVCSRLTVYSQSLTKTGCFPLKNINCLQYLPLLINLRLINNGYVPLIFLLNQLKRMH